MSGHTTKGPWEFHLGIDYACVMGADQLPDTAFCRLYGRSREVEANGRLIAAAPDLLAALKRLHASTRVIDAHTEGCGCTICEARAAILKAEGK